MHAIDQHTMLIAGRLFKDGHPKTALWTMDINSLKLNLRLILPSAGDNSYPGLLLKDDNLFVSYYSMHQDQQSRVYLAKLSIE